MSTFGKRYLRKWDYRNHSYIERKRFNSTSKPFQLELLNKWYPIGMMVHQINSNVDVNGVTHFSYSPNIYIIDSYKETLGCYMLRVKMYDGVYFYEGNPIGFEPTKEEFRQMSLQKLLDL